MLTVIREASVYAPERLGIKDILVGGDKILYIGDKLPPFSKDLNVTEINLKGGRLIPGFIDAHVHVTGGGGESGPDSRVPAVGVSQFTRYGVTTVAGLLGTDDLTRSTSTLITQTCALNAEGLTAFCYTGGYHIPPTTLTGSVKSDIVHVEQMIGFGELAISDHRSSQPTLDEFLRLASETYVASLMTGKAGTLHLHVGGGKRGLELVRKALDVSEIPARIFHPTHVNRAKTLFDEACALTKRGVTIDVTAYPVPAGLLEDLWAHEALLLYFKGGFDRGRITVSSDGGGCLPIFNNEGEMLQMDVGSSSLLIFTVRKLLGAGLPLEEVLPPFTTNVARLLRFKTKGKIAAGFDADLVHLSADNEIQDVMARGVWHLREGKVCRRGMFEKND